MRIFGNEIRFDDFQGFDLDTLKEKFNYLQWLIELAREHEIDATKSVQFLDSSLNIPTVVGLPLKLEAQGNAVMDVKVKHRQTAPLDYLQIEFYHFQKPFPLYDG